MRKVTKIAVLPAILLIPVLLLVLFVFTPYAKRMAKNSIQEYLLDQYGAKVEIGAIDYRFSPLIIEVQNIRLYGGPQNERLFLQAGRLIIEAPLSILWRRDRVIRRLVLENPSIDFESLPKLKEQEKSEEPGSLQIHDIELRGASAAYAGKHLQDVRITANLKPDSLLVTDVRARFSTAGIRVNGRLDDFENPRYSAKYELKGDAAFFHEILGELPQLNGPVSAAGTIVGTIDRYQIEGTLNAGPVKRSEGMPFSLRAAYEIDSSNKSAPYSIHLNWRGIQPDVFQEFTSSIPSMATTTEGVIQYSGGADPWSARATIRTTLRKTGGVGFPVAGRLNASLRAGRIEVQQSTLSVRSADALLSGHIGRNTMNLKVQANIPKPADFSDLSRDLRRLPGAYRADIHLTGPYDHIRATGLVRGVAPDLNLSVGGSYAFVSQELSAEYNVIAGSRTLSRILDLPANGTIRLNGTAGGTVSALLLNGKVSATDLRLNQFPAGQLLGEYSSNGKVLQATLQLPDLSTSFTGRYAMATAAFAVSATTTNLGLDRLRSVLPNQWKEIEGTITASLEAKGDVDHWKQSEAHLQIEEARFSRNGFRAEVQKGSRILMDRGTASLDLRGLFQDSPLKLSGKIRLVEGYPLDLLVSGTIDLAIASLLHAGISAEGFAGLDLHIEGRLSNPEITGNVSSENFTVLFPAKSMELQQAKLVANLEGSHAVVDFNGKLNGGTIDIQGRLPFDPKGVFDVKVSAQNDASLLSRFAEDIRAAGAITLDATITGRLSDPAIVGTVKTEELSIELPEKNLSFANVRVEAIIGPGMIQAESTGLFNQAPVKLEAELPLDLRIGAAKIMDKPGKFQLTVRSLSLATLLPESNVTGAVTVQAEATGQSSDLSLWAGLLSITPENVMLEETPLIAKDPIEVTLKNGIAELRPVQLNAGEFLNLQATARYHFPTRAITATVEGSGELHLLSQLLTDIHAAGHIKSSLYVSGRIEEPNMSGIVQIQDGSFRIPDSPLLLGKIEMTAPIDKDRIRVEHFSAVMGGGNVEGAGEISLTNWLPSAMDFRLTARNVAMNYPEHLRSQSNADLRLQQTNGEFLLSGKITITRSVYEEDIDYRDRLVNTLLSRKQELSTQPAFVSRLRMNLDIQTIDDFRLRNNLARIRASAKLHIEGNPAAPRLSGRVSVREGSKLYFEGNQFEVNRGLIEFYGSRRIEPVFDVELFSLVRDVESNIEYEITLPIRGALTDLEDVEPLSVPYLPSNSIYFLLVTGRADAQFSEATSLFVQRQLVGYFTGQLFFDVQQRIAGAFGLSRVEIQPELVSSETDPGAKLVVGKDFTSALSLIYSTSLTESQERTWIANYRVKRNLSVRFIDQEEGSYTGALRHNIRLGPGVSFSDLQQRSIGPDDARIRSITIENNSRIPDEQILKILDIETGEEYDFWELYDGLNEVEKKLQKMGYLFPQATFEEKEEKDSVDLAIRVDDGGLREMLFSGSKVGKKEIGNYQSWWREGFAEEAVVELIRDDLLRSLWIKGYHRAVVEWEIVSTNEKITYLFRIQPGTLYSTSEILFTGADRFPKNELAAQVQNFYGSRAEMVSDALHNFRSIANNVAALYVQRGFLDTQVKEGTARYETGKVFKELRIIEGSQSKINAIVLSNQSKFPPDLLRSLKITEGKLYDPQALQEDELTISSYYEERGYRDFDLEPEIQRVEGRSDLVLFYRINPGGIARIASVEIRGNNITRRGVIEKRLPFRVGDVLTRDKLGQAQKNLADLRLFHQIRVDAEKTETPDEYRVIVDVIEMKRYEFTYGIRYDTETDLGGEVQIQDLNLFGTGNSLSFLARRNSNPRETLEPNPNRDLPQLFRLVYHSPTVERVLPTLRWKTLVSASFQEGEFSNFLSRRLNAIIQRQFALFHPFYLLANYEFTRTYTKSFDPDSPIPLFIIDASRLIGTVLADTRDDPINTRRGMFLSNELEYAPGFLGSDIIFIKNLNQFFYYRPVGRLQWASGLRVGLGKAFRDDILIGSERFFAGGSYTLRGFRLDEVGPRSFVDGEPRGGQAVLIINQEIRFPIYRWIRGVAFYDGGNVYEFASDFSLSDLRHSAGFGLRLDTPFGLGRFDLGINLDPRRSAFPEFEEPRYVLHFGIGQAF